MNPNLSPVDWAKRPLQKYADFTGRAPRPEYWWYFLALVIASVVLSIIEGIIGLKGMVLGIYGPLTLLLILATIVPSLAVGARRLHDTNRSGWWLLLGIVPYALMLLFRPAAGSPFGAMALFGIASLIALICGIVVLVFMVLPGTPGDNRFGPPIGESTTIAAE
ncbi:MAG TPA: DUF805 domain-containing protein [Sphingomicrobium sp.]|jgi:uncharacterized membrane protein YhaH (DUF805 family)|nr:DUF805 domain-containing protein [Sphingomicrobium sp.]